MSQIFDVPPSAVNFQFESQFEFPDPADHSACAVLRRRHCASAQHCTGMTNHAPPFGSDDIMSLGIIFWFLSPKQRV